MTRLQAAMKDSAAKSWRERKLYYKVGSYFKGCFHCGEKIEVESESGKVQLRYLSGFDVFRAYDPKGMGWTYYCWTCGAKDLQCWRDATDIGLPAIRGAHDAIYRARAKMRKEAARNDEPRKEVSSRSAEIAKLQAELEELKAMLKGEK